MSTTMRPLEEVTQEGIRLLARELGLADTARFLRHFVGGSGNYVEERHALLGNPSVEEFFEEVHRREALRAAPRER